MSHVYTPTDMLLVHRHSSDAQLPVRQSKGAAGYDLYSAEDATVASKSLKLVSTGISISLPESTYGRVAPRSGNVVKYGVTVDAGVIDSDYTGIVKVAVRNWGESEFRIAKGDRIAQLIVEAIHCPDVKEVAVLSETERGTGGFGSTGRN